MKGESNPIMQDTKKGKLRFPYHGPIFRNYGCLPGHWKSTTPPRRRAGVASMAWRSTERAVTTGSMHEALAPGVGEPEREAPRARCFGDDDPIDVVEIGSSALEAGSVASLRLPVSGDYAVHDGELDWKVIAINAPRSSRRTPRRGVGGGSASSPLASPRGRRRRVAAAAVAGAPRRCPRRPPRPPHHEQRGHRRDARRPLSPRPRVAPHSGKRAPPPSRSSSYPTSSFASSSSTPSCANPARRRSSLPGSDGARPRRAAQPEPPQRRSPQFGYASGGPHVCAGGASGASPSGGVTGHRSETADASTTRRAPARPGHGAPPRRASSCCGRRSRKDQAPRSRVLFVLSRRRASTSSTCNSGAGRLWTPHANLPMPRTGRFEQHDRKGRGSRDARCVARRPRSSSPRRQASRNQRTAATTLTRGYASRTLCGLACDAMRRGRSRMAPTATLLAAMAPGGGGGGGAGQDDQLVKRQARRARQRHPHEAAARRIGRD